jgi:hypothetical protein
LEKLQQVHQRSLPIVEEPEEENIRNDVAIDLGLDFNV